MSDGSWKKHLLRSGVPLEYEVGKILSARGMSISADLSFTRRDGMATKESSVDIHSQWYDSSDPNLSLEILVECKFRSKNKTFLFLPDPNESYSPATLGGTVQTFDFMMPYTISKDGFVELERNAEYVYKGIELSDEGAFQDQLWHGIQQLRYGVPVNLKNAFEFNLLSNISDSVALFFSNILVTNASIRVLNSECKISDIESASSLSEISSEKDFVVLYSDYGPDYEDHFKTIFSGFLLKNENEAIERRKLIISKGKTVNWMNDPLRIFNDFENAIRYPLHNVGTQFFIVNLSHLDNLISRIQNYCVAAYNGRSVS